MAKSIGEARDASLLVSKGGAPLDQVLRWRLRNLLAFLPARLAVPRRSGRGALRIAYLFAGTYGDFVQCLTPLRRLAAAYPGCDLILVGAAPFAREFLSELPACARLAHPPEPWSWIIKPVDLLFTNAVGVFRVRFDFAARFCARRAFGFRHEKEKRRGGYFRTLKLDAAVKNFAEENLKLLDLGDVPEVWSLGPGPGSGLAAPRDTAMPLQVPDPWGQGRVLFHIGSAGLKRDFGLPVYTRLVLNLLGKLEAADAKVEVVMGPGDEDIALEVSTGSHFVPQMYPMTRLIRMLRSFQGTVVCFNSFLAHLCHYLGKPAIVVHRGAVPYGYDCDVLHRQIVLREENRWDVAEVIEAVKASR